MRKAEYPVDEMIIKMVAKSDVRRWNDLLAGRKYQR